jgi:hypothetical protein
VANSLAYARESGAEAAPGDKREAEAAHEGARHKRVCFADTIAQSR